MDINILKNRFIELIKSIKRDGADIDGLLNYLENSDFYNTPASTQYNCSFEHGLLIHSLNQYYLLKDLAKQLNLSVDDTSLKILGLLNEIYKVDFYELTTKREKIDGNWIDKVVYKVKPADKRFLCGDNAFNSYYILNNYIPLKRYEAMAIVNQNPDIENNASNTTALSYNPLVVLLRCANLMNMYIIENNNIQEDFIYKGVINE